MTSAQSKRPIVAALFGCAATLLACVVHRVEWTLETSSGGACKVHLGMKREAVLAACGSPTRAGDQPKRAGGSAGMCSSPCDLYKGSLVLYGCDGGLAEVEEVSGEWQHCVLQP
jgi:hypothetical protein